MSVNFGFEDPKKIVMAHGTKQNIAQAMYEGRVHPTPGLLAAMLIDARDRDQAIKAGGQPTVLQQVLGGGGSPMPSPQGLGANPSMPPPPPNMPPMAPPQMAPQAPQGTPPQGMAMGGIASLPVPDAMFDEPMNGGFGDGYAGGGLVAFAQGGMSNLYDDVEYWESRGDQSAVSPKGARGVMQLMPGTIKDPGFGVKPMQADTEKENRRVGREYLDAMYRRYGDQVTALAAYNWGPGNVDKWLKSGADPKKLPAETRKYISNIMKGSDAPLKERNIQSPEGRRRVLMDQFGVAKDLFATLPDSRLGEAAEYYKGETSEETKKKNRKDDMWMAIAQLGANLAASDSPQFLQAVGQAIARTMPGVEATKKERKTAERSAMNALTDIYGLQRKEAKEVFDFGARLAEAELGAENTEAAREFARSERIDAEKTRAKEARIAQEAGKSPEERQIDAYFREFKKANRNLSDEDAYQRAVIAARTALEGTKPAARGAASNQQTIEGIRAAAGAQNEFKYLGTE